MFSPNQVETVKKALGDIEAGKYIFPPGKTKEEQQQEEKTSTKKIPDSKVISQKPSLSLQEPEAIQLTLKKIKKESKPLEEEPEIFEEEPEPQKKDKEHYKYWTRKIELVKRNIFGKREITPRPYKSICLKPFEWSQTQLGLVQYEFKNFVFILYCGAGAFGRVWLVKDDRRGIIALKILPKSAISEIMNVQLYQTNVTDFSHLLEIYKIGETKHFYYYTMEAAYSYDSGEYKPYTLDLELLKKHFTANEIIPIIGDILLGALHLHDNGVAHRDIKPNNIIFINEKPKLADVGLVCRLSEMCTWGTFGFLPTDLRHETDTWKWRYRGIDCDLYAIGKVLYLMLSGFMLEFFPELSEEVLRDKKGKQLNLIMNKACAETQEERYQNAQTFYEELMLLQRQKPPINWQAFFSKIPMFHR